MSVTSPNSVNDGNWHKVVITANTTDGTLKTYFDGSALNTANLNVPHLDMMFNQIGFSYSPGYFASNYYTGEVDDYEQADSGVLTSTNGYSGGSIGFSRLLLIVMLLAARSTLKAPITRTVALSMVLGLMSLNTHAGTVNTACTSNSDRASGFKPCWYAGFGGGQSFVRPEDEGSGWNVTDDQDIGYKFSIGYRFLPSWFAELSYADLGKAELEHLNPAVSGVENITYKAPALGVGRYLLSGTDRSWNLFVKGSISSIKNESSAERLPYKKDDSVQLALGFGGEYRFNDQWFVRLELDSYDEDARHFLLSANRHFGKRSTSLNLSSGATNQVITVSDTGAARHTKEHAESVISPVNAGKKGTSLETNNHQPEIPIFVF